MKDLFGKAMLDFYTNNNFENIITETSISEPDEMEIDYMFRNFADMPSIEQRALSLCCGNVLDVGCGAGSHALYLQNNKKLNITAIDFSENAIKTCKLRSLQNAHVANFFTFQSDTKFDTILLLMNGTGICGKLCNLPNFLQKLKSLLAVDGQILIDSTDISYMYDIDKNGAIILPFKMEYLGELEFFLNYKNEKEFPFYWLYLDFETLKTACKLHGFSCELVLEGDNSTYLAKIKLA